MAAYLAAWGRADYPAMRRLVADPPADFTAVQRQAAADLELRTASYRAGRPSVSGDRATVAVTAVRTLAVGRWVSRTTLRLRLVGGRWRVRWSPTTVDPHLGAGDRFAVAASWPARAPILGQGGAPLTNEVPMVHVGLVGARVTDPAGVTAALEAAGAPAAQVTAALAQAQRHPQQFVEVFDLTRTAYDQVEAQLYPVPGTTFEPYTARQALTPDLAAHVVGTTGPVTAQQLAQLGPPYAAGDVVGQTGIEAADERQLAGTPGGRVTVVDAAGATVAVLATFAARPGTAVLTTIDPPVEEAAESALDAVTQPADLVAVQASTGEVLAAVTRPDTSGFDAALDGEYPPGSTFKVVTTAALVEHGLGATSPAPCPSSITVDGEVFHNFEGEASDSLDLEQAFAESCNAAFIRLVQTTGLPPAALPQAAAAFGLGAALHPGLAAFGGSVPTPASAAEEAADAIGQGRVVVSPLVMAGVAAAVDAGSVHPARLVTGAPDDAAPATPVDAGVLAVLRPLMAAVVTSPEGTAAGAGLPAGTYGKTGTAEYGSGPNPPTHAWFIGYDQDLAFAVLVVGGGVGGQVAAPVAARFLADLGPAGVTAAG